MNTRVLVFAFAVLVAACVAQNSYGWPDAYERFLARQGVWDYERHRVRDDYRNRNGGYEQNLVTLYQDWTSQTGYGQTTFDETRFVQPNGGYGQYGFPGY